MRKTHLFGAAVTAAALCALAAPVATATPALNGPTVLTLTITHTDQSLLPDEVAVLSCAPDTGTHPKAEQACQDLNRVNGNIAQLTPKDGYVCTLDYTPRTVAVRGTFRGTLLSWEKQFPNSCTMLAETGNLFAFSTQDNR